MIYNPFPRNVPFTCFYIIKHINNRVVCKLLALASKPILHYFGLIRSKYVCAREGSFCLKNNQPLYFSTPNSQILIVYK